MLCESRSPNCSCICSLFLDSMTWNMDWTFWTTIWGAGLEEKRELQLLPILFFFIRIFQILTRKNVRGCACSCWPGVSWTVLTSAANRLIVEVVQSRRRPLLGTSPGWKRLLPLSHLRHYEDTMLNGRWPHGLSTWNWVRDAIIIRDGRL